MKNRWKKIVVFILVIGMIVQPFSISKAQMTEDNKIILSESTGHTYYLDSLEGNDNNTGLSEEDAWQSLKKASEIIYEPGDRLLLKRGSIWNGEQLYPKGSGTQESPIILSTYGEGEKPIINGNGLLEDGEFISDNLGKATLYLKNSEYWEISDLEVTNDDPNFDGYTAGTSNKKREEYRSGIAIQNDDSGTLNHLYINNCYVHHVDARIEGESQKSCGGIVTLITSNSGNQVKSKWNDLKIENNLVEELSHEGIYMDTYWYKIDNMGGNGGNFYPSTNVVIRGNTIRHIAGDGIVLIGTIQGLVEHNLAIQCNSDDWDKSGNPHHAAIWMWASREAVFQYNEAYETNNAYDGQAYDFDYGVYECIYQYNYSHDNQGGFLLVCAGWPGNSKQNVARYNVSVNDGTVKNYPSDIYQPNIISLSGGSSNNQLADTVIHNNTIYVNPYISNGPQGEQALKAVGQVCGDINNVTIANNLFYYNKGISTNELAFSQNANIHYKNNAYYKCLSANDEKPIQLIDSPFIGEGDLSIAPKGTPYHLPDLTAYQTKKNSALIDAGVDLSDVLPGGILPATTDYFGNLLEDGAPDIGAYEYQGKKDVIEENEVNLLNDPDNPSSWSKWPYDVTIDQKTEDNQSYLEIKSGTGDSSGGGINQQITLEANTMYKFSGQMKVVNADTQIILGAKTAGGEQLPVVSKVEESVNDIEWKEVSLSFITQNAGKAEISVWINQTNNTLGYVRNLSLVKVSTPSVINNKLQTEMGDTIDSVKVSWNYASGQDITYRVYYTTNITHAFDTIERIEAGVLAANSLKEKFYILKGLKPKKEYFVNIIACDKNGGKTAYAPIKIKTSMYYSILNSTKENAGGTIEMPSTVPEGGAFQIVVKPDSGFTLAYLKINGIVVDACNNIFYKDNVTEEINVEAVFKPIENISISLDKTQLIMKEGESYILNAIVEGDNSIIWNTEGDSITIELLENLNKVRIKAIKPGKAIVKAALKGEENKIAVCDITITENDQDNNSGDDNSGGDNSKDNSSSESSNSVSSSGSSENKNNSENKIYTSISNDTNEKQLILQTDIVAELTDIKVPENLVSDLIKEAQKKKKEENINQIKIKINCSFAGFSNKANILLTENSINEIKKGDVACVELVTPLSILSLDKKIINQIQEQSQSNVTISMQKVSKLSEEAREVIGERPVIEFTIMTDKEGQIKNFKDGFIEVTIPYQLREKEKEDKISGVYLKEDKVPEWIKSTYNAETEALIFKTNHFSVFGIGYIEDGNILLDKTKITLKKKNLFLKKAKQKTTKIKVKLPYQAKTAQVTFASKNKKIAKVSEKGKIVAKKAGKTTIETKVYLNDGTERIFKTKIKVKEKN